MNAKNKESQLFKVDSLEYPRGEIGEVVYCGGGEEVVELRGVWFVCVGAVFI